MSSVVSILLSGWSFCVYSWTIIACIWMWNFFRPWGKSIEIVMEDIKGSWFARKPKLIDSTQKTWQAKKGESHVQEADKTAYIAGGGIFSNPVHFYRKGRTRPLYVHFEEIPHVPKDDNYNPSSDDWDSFATQRAYEQQKNANKTNQKPNWSLIILAAIAAGAICFMLAYFFLPPHYIPFNCGGINGTCIMTSGSTGSNGAVTRTITTASGSPFQTVTK